MAISIAQTVAASANGAGSVTATISSSGAGNLLLVVVECSNQTVGLTPSVSAGTTQTFTNIVNQNIANGGQLNAWYVKNCASGSTGITVTRATGTGGWGLIVRELVSADTSAPLDQSTSSSSFQTTGTTATTTQGDEFWWASFGAISPGNGTQATMASISSPWVDGVEAKSSATSPNNNATTHDGYQIVSSTGTANATITVTNSNGNISNGIVATFKAAVAATDPFPAGYYRPKQDASTLIRM